MILVWETNGKRWMNPTGAAPHITSGRRRPRLAAPKAVIDNHSGDLFLDDVVFQS